LAGGFGKALNDTYEPGHIGSAVRGTEGLILPITHSIAPFDAIRDRDVNQYSVFF